MISTSVLSSDMIIKMFLEATKRLEEKKDYLNNINVFPVPDGDTGLNMYLSVKRISDDLMKLTEIPDQKTLLKKIMRSSIMGARGNSGVILSQFVMGFCKTLSVNANNITPHVFAEAIVAAKDYAYNAIINPVEGTMLTIIRYMAEEAEKLLTDDSLTWEHLLVRIYNAAKEGLVKTPELMPLLKEAGVYDSGAQGLVYIIEGWVIAFTSLEIEETHSEMHEKINIEYIKNMEVKHRYCTQFVLTTDEITPEEVKELLVQYGDSLHVNYIENIIRVHIHTNNPEEVMSLFKEKAEISSIKVDDMLSQKSEMYS